MSPPTPPVTDHRPPTAAVPQSAGGEAGMAPSSHQVELALKLRQLDQRLRAAEELLTRARNVLSPVLAHGMPSEKPVVPSPAPKSTVGLVVGQCQARVEAIITITEDLIARATTYPLP